MPRACPVAFHVSSHTESDQREAPRGKPVASVAPHDDPVAANVRLHGTSPWHRRTEVGGFARGSLQFAILDRAPLLLRTSAPSPLTFSRRCPFCAADL